MTFSFVRFFRCFALLLLVVFAPGRQDAKFIAIRSNFAAVLLPVMRTFWDCLQTVLGSLQGAMLDGGHVSYAVKGVLCGF